MEFTQYVNFLTCAHMHISSVSIYTYIQISIHTDLHVCYIHIVSQTSMFNLGALAKFTYYRRVPITWIYKWNEARPDQVELWKARPIEPVCDVVCTYVCTSVGNLMYIYMYTYKHTLTHTGGNKFLGKAYQDMCGCAKVLYRYTHILYHVHVYRHIHLHSFIHTYIHT